MHACFSEEANVVIDELLTHIKANVFIHFCSIILFLFSLIVSVLLSADLFLFPALYEGNNIHNCMHFDVF